MTSRALCLPVIFLLVMSCATSRKLASIRDRNVSATISLQENTPDTSACIGEDADPYRDTLSINIDGHKMLIMRAVRDDLTGDMVATEELRAAVVTARFRNVAERHGKVDLQFDVCAPAQMCDSRWQIRLSPVMHVLEDTMNLDDVIITGREYRKAQLRGYQQYERFLSRIVNDPGRFVDRHCLEVFIMRNIPELYAFRADSAEVADSVFASSFGVTEIQALEHYTNKIAVYFNNRRKSMKDMMYSRYVKAPIVTDHIRLDSVVVDLNGDFHYLYTQTVNVTPRLKKVGLTLSGAIFEQDKKLYSIPESQALTFYISSLSTLVDSRERYLTRIIERKVVADASWNVDFRLGSCAIEENLGDNWRQIGDIKKCIVRILENETFDLDSVTVSAFASPDGSFRSNELLSRKRAESTMRYFKSFINSVSDSISRNRGFEIVVDDGMNESGMSFNAEMKDMSFRTSASGENWPLLEHLVENDTVFSASWKKSYEMCSELTDPDLRETAMRNEPFYQYMKENLYPLLRTVQFNFHLHRKGMVKDTIHTTVLDSLYMDGVQAIRDRDYETAVRLLMPYDDFNTAIAYASLDRNVSAFNILQKLEKTASVDYMMALICSRLGDKSKAVQHYIESCRQDASFIHRGNLDPEISELIKNYKLDKQLQTNLL